MPLQKQVAPLSMSMDSDSGDKYINTSGGVVRERVCMRINELDGDSLFNKKLKGNVLVDLAMPAGTNKCIGWCPDHKTESLLWFVYNSAGNHSVLRFFVDTEVIQKVWYSQSGLGLQDAFLSACVADGRVSWVNGTEQPKSFNIEKAVNFTNSLSGEAYLVTDNIETEILPLIKRPPQFAPEASYASVLEEAGLPVNFNNLRGKLFQFKYNFVYEDDQESAYSEISKVPLPEGDLTVSGEWVQEFSTNNAIVCKFNTGSNIVKKINVAARMCSDHNVGEFNIFRVIEKFDDSGIQLLQDYSDNEVNFLNNGLIRNINTEINNRYCDDVPLNASGITLLSGKYTAMSMPVKGYDPVTADFELTHSFEDAEFGTSTVNMGRQVVDEPHPIYITPLKITLPNEIILNSVYKITVTFGDKTVLTASQSIGSTTSLTIEQIRNKLYDQLHADPRLTLYWVSTEGTASLIMRYSRSSGIGSDTPSVVRAFVEKGSVASFKSFKKAQYHKIGIVYNDEFGRYNILNNDRALFVPWHDNGADHDQISKISFQINHRPPAWAKTYRFAYVMNMSYSYFHYFDNVELIRGGTGGIPAGSTFLKLNQSVDSYREYNSKIIIPNYVWIKGDRCRFVLNITGRQGGEFDTNSYEVTSNYVRTYMDGETEVKEDGFLVDHVFGGTSDSASLVEVFRPNFEFVDNILYEVSESYQILDWGTGLRRHSANEVDQSDDLATPASGTLNFGDVYMRERKTGDTNTVIVEDSSYSDFYLSECIDKGRAVVKITGGSEQKTLHRVVRSENYIEGSEYNLLNVFLPQTEFFTVSQSYGPITGITEVGDVLKVIQEHKETSVYIGKASLKQADGTSITVISDKVFNEGNKYDSLHGTKYPRSIAVNERNLYYLDDTTCDLIRSAPNGQESISAFYKMKSYFKRKVEELRASANYTDIIISIDSLYEEVLITFINGNSSETIAFYEKEGQKGFTWKAQIKPASDVPDNFAWYGDRLFSFLSGKLWKHDVGVETTFYGDRKPCSVSFIVNAGAGDANKFSDIEMSSPDNVWDVVFDIAAGSNYPVQKTILKPAIIREKENRLYSGILRNILGRNNIEDVSKLRNGSQMTGETMLVTISNNTAGDYILKEVEVKFLTSK